MRWHIKTALAVTATLMLTGMAQAQGGGFFPGGRGGPGAGADPAALLRNPSVKKDLKLEDEQLAKLPAAQMKALAEILSPQQLTRLKQITLQLKGPAAFLEKDVQTELKLSAEQVNNITTIQKDANEQRKEAFAMMKEGQFAEAQQKMQEITKDTQKKTFGLLNVQQKQQWKRMTGPEFKMEAPKFGGFGGGSVHFRSPEINRPEPVLVRGREE
jgi:hypothetical protein